MDTGASAAWLKVILAGPCSFPRRFSCAVLSDEVSRGGNCRREEGTPRPSVCWPAKQRVKALRNLRGHAESFVKTG